MAEVSAATAMTEAARLLRPINDCRVMAIEHPSGSRVTWAAVRAASHGYSARTANSLRAILRRPGIAPSTGWFARTGSRRRPGGDLDQNVCGTRALLGGDIEGGHRAQHSRREREHQDATLFRACHYGRRIGSTRRQGENEDVRLYVRQIDIDAVAHGERLRDASRVRVIFRQAGEVVIQRVESRCGEDSHLTHRSSEHSSVARGPS